MGIKEDNGPQEVSIYDSIDYLSTPYYLERTVTKTTKKL